jgi:hypothetical protein
MGLKDDFPSFEAQIFGLVSGTVNAASFPSVQGKMGRFVAHSTNVYPFFIGAGDIVVFELNAGADSGWFPIIGGNLNLMQFKSTSGTSTDKLAYWLQG